MELYGLQKSLKSRDFGLRDNLQFVYAFCQSYRAAFISISNFRLSKYASARDRCLIPNKSPSQHR